MKTWKRLVSGLLSLALAASLTGTALAAKPAAKTSGAAAETAKTETPAPKLAGQFSQWFPRLEADPKAPEAAEAILARMGTAVKQSKTVNGVTATLNGAIWDGNDLRLSLTLKAPNIPKEVTKETNLYTEECTLALPEEDWKEYLRKDEEHHYKELAEMEGMEDYQEGMEQSIQNLLDMGQADYWNHVNILNFPLVSREKDTLTFEVWMSFKDYLKQPEITLHLENIATYEDGKGNVTWHDGKRTGPGPKDVILKGPMDFTFTLENILPPINYTGDVKITAEKVPLRFTGVEISAFDVNVDYEVLTPVNMIHVTKPGEPEPKPDSDKLAHEDVSKALHGIVQGLWTKDGAYVDLSQRGGSSSMGTSPDGTCDGNVGVGYAYPMDPAAVTAVKLGETRVELAKLTPVTGQTAEK